MSRRATFLGGPRDGMAIDIGDDVTTIQVIDEPTAVNWHTGAATDRPPVRPTTYRVGRSRRTGRLLLIRDGRHATPR